MGEVTRVSDPEDRPKTFIDVIDQDASEATGLFAKERPVDQLETKRYSDRVLGETTRCCRHEDIPGDPSTGNVRGQRDHVGLPDIYAKHIVGGHDHTRSAFVELDPAHRASRYHGAERSIRSKAASDSSAVGDSAPASPASAISCWERLNPECVAA